MLYCYMLKRGSFIKYAITKGEGGQAKVYAMRTGGLIHVSTYAKNSLFACILLYSHMQGAATVLCCV